MPDPLLLPPGVRVVHIGPHKTGTTAVQSAFHHAREALHEQDVHYAHPRPQAYKPAIALTGLTGRRGGPKVDDTPWRRLVAEVERQQDRRVVISSESFSNAERPHIERLAQDLGHERVHVVRMLRRYDKMLPSQWQQHIAAGRRQSFDAYLREVAADPEHSFWHRHGFVGLTRRWTEVFGPANVTTVVVDESDHEWLLRVFERLVGLELGTLRAEPDRSNRSLTRGEVELLRRFNDLRQQVGWADRVHFHYVRLAASPAMRRLPADPEGGRLSVPSALRPRLVEATERDLADLARLGVRVVGDTELLRPPPHDTPGWADDEAAPATVTVRSAAAAVTAVVERAVEHGPIRLAAASRGSAAAPPYDGEEPDPVVEVVALPRRSAIHLLPPPGPEGRRLRAWVRTADGAFAAARRSCRVVERLEDVAGRRSQVVLVAVPPRQLLAGRWQEHVLGRGEAGFGAWQDELLPGESELPQLVRDAVARWGAGRVSVLATDAFAPGHADAMLAALGDVEPGSLPEGTGSRALLSWAETALLRRLDETAREQGWDEDTWDRYVRRGVVPWLLSSPPPRLHQGIALDEQSAQWVRHESRALLGAVAESGVRVLGDLGPLRRGARARPTAASEPRIRPGSAALALGGAIAATGQLPAGV